MTVILGISMSIQSTNRQTIMLHFDRFQFKPNRTEPNRSIFNGVYFSVHHNACFSKTQYLKWFRSLLRFMEVKGKCINYQHTMRSPIEMKSLFVHTFFFFRLKTFQIIIWLICRINYYNKH